MRVPTEAEPHAGVCLCWHTCKHVSVCVEARGWRGVSFFTVCLRCDLTLNLELIDWAR